MNAPHIHLILNHIPILGVMFGILILLHGLFYKNESIIRLALLFFVACAIVTMPVYFSGESAEEILEHQANISHKLIHEHEEVAEKSALAMYGLGILSLLTLLWAWRSKKLHYGLVYGVLILSLGVFGLMVWTANSGGLISHPEIQHNTKETSTPTKEEQEED